MTKLEDITVGSSVKGIISNSTVTIVAVQWYGNNVLEITYKDSHGQPGNQMLLRDEEINLTVMDNSLPWSFDADGEQMKLASEAYFSRKSRKAGKRSNRCASGKSAVV